LKMASTKLLISISELSKTENCGNTVAPLALRRGQATLPNLQIS